MFSLAVSVYTAFGVKYFVRNGFLSEIGFSEVLPKLGKAIYIGMFRQIQALGN
jgi:hypothetical protein